MQGHKITHVSVMLYGKDRRVAEFIALHRFPLSLPGGRGGVNTRNDLTGGGGGGGGPADQGDDDDDDDCQSDSGLNTREGFLKCTKHD